MTGIATIVRDAIADQLRIGIERVTVEAQLYEDLDVDSLDLVRIVVDLENRLDVDLPDDVAEGLKTVGDLITRVQKVMQ